MKFLNIKISSIIFIFFLLLKVGMVQSQAILSNPIGNGYLESNFGFSAATLFNGQDFLLDFGLGYDDTGMDFSVMINGTFRPYHKTGLLEISDHYFYQVEEKVIQFSLDIEKRFFLIQFINENKVGLYAFLKSGYFWGKYKGLDGGRNNQFALNPGGGLVWQLDKACRFQLGYLYFNQNSFAPANMIQIKLGFWIGNTKNED